MTVIPDLFDDSDPAKARPAKPRAVAKKSDAGPGAGPSAKQGQKKNGRANDSYTAQDIEVLEGLEPVRLRPGMYVGGTDEKALHHLAAEVIDNAMDEVVAGHATRVEIDLAADGSLTIRDNGRGIPVDPHPKFKDKSALEVILTTLHSGGKFSGKAYQTSGGLHGVGVSVVNALAERLDVEVARDGHVWKQSYSRGVPQTKLKKVGTARNRRGTTVTFMPDSEIFGPRAVFKPATLFRMARSKAYLIRDVEVRWFCAPELLEDDETVPQKSAIKFPGGVLDYLTEALGDRPTWTENAFFGTTEFNSEGRVEWAIAWPGDEKGFTLSYVNTVPTPQGGSHEQGFRAALLKGLRSYGELVNAKKAAAISGDDLMEGACVMLSVFIPNPQFQGQTKERLGMPEAVRYVENAVKDHVDHFLSKDPASARRLLDHMLEKADERMRRRKERDLARQSATRKLRLPGKLSDCSERKADGTEIFLVEGDSAGGSAKQARNRKFQAILPLRGKILNVASATLDKMRANQELNDLTQALGCGAGHAYDGAKLRYDRVIIMTDADVDGAHIASLLLTFFFREMPQLIHDGHLYLAQPPLYRLAQGGEVAYARDDAHKDELMKDTFSGRGKVEISRFKGLGEMPPAQLKETTMDPAKRVLLRVNIPNDQDPHQAEEAKETATLVESLMGKKPELRFAYIQDHARFVADVDV